jgi:hypothetical protein
MRPICSHVHETIGLAHRIPIFDLSFMKIIQLLSLAGLSFPV